MRKLSPLDELLRRPDLWRAGAAANDRQDVLPTGHELLDTALHYGGWPRAALTELLGDGCGFGEQELLLPALRHCSRDRRWLLFLAPPALPYAPALAAAGVRLERLVVARPGQLDALLWCAEQALRSGSCSALLGWLPAANPGYAQLRRLQLAARDGDSLCFLFRPSHSAAQRSPAALRLLLQGVDGGGIGIRVLKQRGGPADQHLSLPRDPRLPRSRLDTARLPAVISPAPRVRRLRDRQWTAIRPAAH
jgi:cell division inhibitor SulA/protein ImuA